MKPEKPTEAADQVTSGGGQNASSLEDAIETLGRSFVDHPGFMWTSTGLEVLHAEWPAYPHGHGLTFPSHALAECPQGTLFFPIDSIDQCTLFAVGEKPRQDPYGSQHLHIAAWNKDLRGLAAAGHLDGVRDEGEVLSFPTGSMELTQKGLHAATIDMLLGPEVQLLGDDLLLHLHEGRFDTAIREASLRVEIALRRASGLSEHGRRLVETCFGEAGVLVPQSMTKATRQTLRN